MSPQSLTPSQMLADAVQFLFEHWNVPLRHDRGGHEAGSSDPSLQSSSPSHLKSKNMPYIFKRTKNQGAELPGKNIILPNFREGPRITHFTQFFLAAQVKLDTFLFNYYLSEAGAGF